MEYKGKVEIAMQEIRSKLQAMEWDMKAGKFNKEKMPYYNSLLEKYEHLKSIEERI